MAENNAASPQPGLTQAQKEALIQNLQEEITERARRLRAEYAERARGLRARLEFRVNRIPQALRKRKLQDLIDEHSEKAAPRQPPIAPPVSAGNDGRPASVRDARSKILKRQSNQISTEEESGKENAAPQPAAQDLPNPKKRTKTTATANSKVVRTASKKVVPSTVLSPKSHNSRTLPRSPIKPGASDNAQTSSTTRPSSPIKPTRTTTKTTARAPSRQAKAKGGNTVDQENEGRASEASNTSANTTIVTKPLSRAKATAKRPAAAARTTVAAIAKKAAGAIKKENAVPATTTAASGRTLRKRG